MPTAPPPTSRYFTVSNRGSIYIITLTNPPQNRYNKAFCQSLASAVVHISTLLVKPGQPGVIITRGKDDKFYGTGLDVDEIERDANAINDGFYPLMHTMLDCPLPTIALLNGHTFGAACLLALAHDYRVMNSERGFFSLPPVDLGIYFSGIGVVPKAKLHPQVARKMLLEAHRWTGKEALADGIVDEIAPTADMQEVAFKLGEKLAPKAKSGVYGLLRSELCNEAIESFQRIQWVHSLAAALKAKAKI